MAGIKHCCCRSERLTMSSMLAGTSPFNSIGTDAFAAPIELSIVMPCLNEAETLPVCVRKARQRLKNNSVSGEIIVGRL